MIRHPELTHTDPDSSLRWNVSQDEYWLSEPDSDTHDKCKISTVLLCKQYTWTECRLTQRGPAWKSSVMRSDLRVWIWCIPIYRQRRNSPTTQYTAWDTSHLQDWHKWTSQAFDIALRHQRSAQRIRSTLSTFILHQIIFPATSRLHTTNKVPVGSWISLSATRDFSSPSVCAIQFWGIS